MSSPLPANVTSLLVEARQLADAHNWSEAADVCQQALNLAPDNVDVLGELGWYLSRAQRYDEAIEVYSNLVRREPNKAKWPYMLGYQYYDQSRWQEAIKWFDQALGLWDTYLVVLYRKGYAHIQLNETELAKQALRKCIAVWRKLEGEEQEREAKHYSDACFQLGKLLLEGGQSRNAEGILSDAVRYGPPDANKHYSFGKALLKNGKTQESLEQFQAANRIEPGKDYILVYTARACMELRDFQEAEAALERIPARRRKAYAWTQIGRLRLLQGQPGKALEALTTATKLEPKNHNQYHLLGQACEACGEFTSAYKAYARAIQLRQDHYHLEFPEAQGRLAALAQYASTVGPEPDKGGQARALPDGYISVTFVQLKADLIKTAEKTNFYN